MGEQGKRQEQVGGGNRFWSRGSNKAHHQSSAQSSSSTKPKTTTSGSLWKRFRRNRQKQSPLLSGIRLVKSSDATDDGSSILAETACSKSPPPQGRSESNEPRKEPEPRKFEGRLVTDVHSSCGVFFLLTHPSILLVCLHHNHTHFTTQSRAPSASNAAITLTFDLRRALRPFFRPACPREPWAATSFR